MQMDHDNDNNSYCCNCTYSEAGGAAGAAGDLLVVLLWL